MLSDVSKWNKYRLGDTKYFNIERGSSEYLKNMAPGDIPYISTTEKNNGITAFVSDSNRKGGLISLAYDGTIGACFYQPEPFFASEKIVTIDTVERPLTKNIAIFLIAILRLESQMYSYGGRKWTVEQQLKQTYIRLPSKDDGCIDYDYMEEYIDSLGGEISDIPDYFLEEGFDQACWYLDNIDQESFEVDYAGSIERKKIQLSERKWDFFKLSDYVTDVHNGKSYNASDLTIAADGDDYISYVTRTDQNNGIAMFVESLEYEGIEKGGAITVGDTTATIFFQEHDFITGPHIIVLRADWFNVYTASFLIALLNIEKYRYPVFGRAFTKDLIRDTMLYLPVNENNEPDFSFMEEYVKARSFSCNIADK